METKFNFKSAICTSREQSEKLLALGLKKETADMCWTKVGPKSRTYYVPELAPINMVSWRHTPAWSLHRLWISIPKYIELGKGNEYEIVMTHGYLKVINDLDDVYKYFDDKDSIYDNIIDCIEWLIKEGYFNKEYLVNQAEIDEHCKGVLEYLDYIRGEEE